MLYKNNVPGNKLCRSIQGMAGPQLLLLLKRNALVWRCVVQNCTGWDHNPMGVQKPKSKLMSFLSQLARQAKWGSQVGKGALWHVWMSQTPSGGCWETSAAATPTAKYMGPLNLLEQESPFLSAVSLANLEKKHWEKMAQDLLTAVLLAGVDILYAYEGLISATPWKNYSLQKILSRIDYYLQRPFKHLEKRYNTWSIWGYLAGH